MYPSVLSGEYHADSCMLEMGQDLIFHSSAIFDDTKEQIREPIVQCVQVKPLPPQPNHQERYRAVFSDIANYVQTMLATRQFDLLHTIIVYHTNHTSRGESCCD